jgi:hypothetical protein
MIHFRQPSLPPNKKNLQDFADYGFAFLEKYQFCPNLEVLVFEMERDGIDETRRRDNSDTRRGSP